MTVVDPSSVNVPRSAIDALREGLDQIPAAPIEREGLYPTLYWAARALVDAADTPHSEDVTRLETVQRICDGYRDRLADELRVLDAVRVLADAPGSAYVRASDLRAVIDGPAPAAPVGELLCRHCGHPLSGHSENGCNGIGGTGDPCFCSPLVACPKCGHALDSPDGCSECPSPEPQCRCGHAESLHNTTSPITPHCMGAGQVEGRFCWCPKFKPATARELIEPPAPVPPEPLRHNHMTRDVKAPGKCPRCDEQRERLAAPVPVSDEAEAKTDYEAGMEAWAEWGIEQVSGDVAKDGRLAFIAGYRQGRADA